MREKKAEDSLDLRIRKSDLEESEGYPAVFIDIFFYYRKIAIDYFPSPPFFLFLKKSHIRSASESRCFHGSRRRGNIRIGGEVEGGRVLMLREMHLRRDPIPKIIRPELSRGIGSKVIASTSLPPSLLVSLANVTAKATLTFVPPPFLLLYLARSRSNTEDVDANSISSRENETT